MRTSLAKSMALLVIVLVVLLTAVEYGPAVIGGKALTISDQTPAPEFAPGRVRPMKSDLGHI
jgi:hypothetical protein